MSNPLRELRALGQSVWYDHISRELLRSGELNRMIEHDGVSGVTSNPTIFEKAIGSERAYDSDIHKLVDEGLNVQQIYENLVISDVREAADILQPLYRESEGIDGYVSLEVSPQLAYDKVGTVEQARYLYNLSDRSNLMIKVPATPQGIEAARELVASGININVTLIFSLEQYRNAANAYIEGLEEWIAMGGDPRRPASVASFFVSRVDTLVDEWLKEFPDPNSRVQANNLMGKAAVANAKIAYSLFKRIFQGERFTRLKDKGARPQRVLWASTSTKNPNYTDTYYVDSLIGINTVNTMPAVTLQAYRDHGRPGFPLEEGLEEARELFPQLEKLGVNMNEVMDRLLENGIKSFADSFELLMGEISKKRTRLLRGWGHRSASLGNLQLRVDQTLARLDNDKVSENLWNGDFALWTDNPATGKEIGQRLGWLQIVETMLGEKQRLKDFADEIRLSGFTCAVLLGMGGSSLTSEVFRSCFGSRNGYLDLKVLDTTVPGSILDLERTLDLEHTLFIVSSKSGGTIEVMSLYKYFRARMDQILGDKAGANFIAITDPGTSLGKLASGHGFRRVFLNPPDIGGRFSALSYFGLVPAALIGVDIDRLLMRASQAVEASGPQVPALESPGLWLGVIMAEASLVGKDKLTLIMSPQISSFGYWLEQLIAESSGKEGKGILPIEGEPIGKPLSYGNDRLFVYLRLDDDSTYDRQVSDLEKQGQPVVTLRFHGPYDVGREIFRFEFATAVAGAILRINPFDQPNVQESKDITKKFLEVYIKDGIIPSGDLLDIHDPDLGRTLKHFFDPVPPGTYFAFNAFIRPSEVNLEILQQIRKIVRDEFRTATALGFGPRYLHSTGQIHKGGSGEGRFILITAEDLEDAPIPGESYSFGVLKTAQSMGDYEALKNKGRKILRIHLASESDLYKLLDAVKDLK